MKMARKREMGPEKWGEAFADVDKIQLTLEDAGDEEEEEDEDDEDEGEEDEDGEEKAEMSEGSETVPAKKIIMEKTGGAAEQAYGFIEQASKAKSTSDAADKVVSMLQGLGKSN